MNSASRPSYEETLKNKFRLLSEELSGYYEKNGVTVKPYHDPSLTNFSQLSIERKHKAVHDLQTFAEITRYGGSEKTQSKALWAILKRARLRPNPDLFRYLAEDDKIEIYNFSGIQLWCNIETLSICSYTLEEIHSFDWLERYQRDELDTQRILKAIEKLPGQATGEPLVAMIPNHQVQERFSEKRFLLDVRHDYFFPLYSEQNQLAAFLVSSKVKILSEQPSSRPPKKISFRLHLANSGA